MSQNSLDEALLENTLKYYDAMERHGATLVEKDEEDAEDADDGEEGGEEPAPPEGGDLADKARARARGELSADVDYFESIDERSALRAELLDEDDEDLEERRQLYRTQKTKEGKIKKVRTKRASASVKQKAKRYFRRMKKKIKKKLKIKSRKATWKRMRAKVAKKAKSFRTSKSLMDKAVSKSSRRGMSESITESISRQYVENICLDILAEEELAIDTAVLQALVDLVIEEEQLQVEPLEERSLSAGQARLYPDLAYLAENPGRKIYVGRGTNRILPDIADDLEANGLIFLSYTSKDGMQAVLTKKGQKLYRQLSTKTESLLERAPGPQDRDMLALLTDQFGDLAEVGVYGTKPYRLVVGKDPHRAKFYAADEDGSAKLGKSLRPIFPGGSKKKLWAWMQSQGMGVPTESVGVRIGGIVQLDDPGTIGPPRDLTSPRQTIETGEPIMPYLDNLGYASELAVKLAEWAPEESVGLKLIEFSDFCESYVDSLEEGIEVDEENLQAMCMEASGIVAATFREFRDQGVFEAKRPDSDKDGLPDDLEDNTAKPFTKASAKKAKKASDKAKEAKPNKDE